MAGRVAMSDDESVDKLDSEPKGFLVISEEMVFVGLAALGLSDLGTRRNELLVRSRTLKEIAFWTMASSLASNWIPSLEEPDTELSEID